MTVLDRDLVAVFPRDHRRRVTYSTWLTGVSFPAEAATGILIRVTLVIEVLRLDVAGVIALPTEMDARSVPLY